MKPLQEILNELDAEIDATLDTEQEDDLFSMEVLDDIEREHNRLFKEVIRNNLKQ